LCMGKKSELRATIWIGHHLCKRVANVTEKLVHSRSYTKYLSTF
jgi:hypothetical protein